MTRIGVVGGSGLYDLEGLTDCEDVVVDTPFGAPSDAIRVGSLGGVQAAFLPRHARGHKLLPSEVPYRANIYALKKLGVEWLVSISAVGSLAQRIVPGHAVAVDQFIDRTKARPSTFFGGGVVAHIGFGEPTCAVLRGELLRAAREAGVTVHDGGTYVAMEGPAFSTKAESELYRSWGADVIGMTAMPEAKLAREAGMSYAILGFATDYDCWHPDHDAVTVEQVIGTLTANVGRAKETLKLLIPRLGSMGPSPFRDVLKSALFTPPEAIDDASRERLAAILGPKLS